MLTGITGKAVGKILNISGQHNIIHVCISMYTILLFLFDMYNVMYFRPHISDSGSCDISVSSVALSLSVLVGADSQGHATLSTTGCSLNIGNLDIHFHGGAR